MSTGKAPQRRRITVCFLLLGKPLQYPPTQVQFALQRGSCKEHRCYCSPTNSPQTRLYLHASRDNHSPKTCCRIIGPNCVNLVVFTQTVPGMTARGGRVTQHQRVETQRQCQSPRPNERKQLVVRRDSPCYWGWLAGERSKRVRLSTGMQTLAVCAGHSGWCEKCPLAKPCPL